MKNWLAIRFRRTAQRLVPLPPREFDGFWEPRLFKGDDRLRLRTNGVSSDTEMLVGNQPVSNCTSVVVTIKPDDLVRVVATFENVPVEFYGVASCGDPDTTPWTALRDITVYGPGGEPVWPTRS